MTQRARRVLVGLAMTVSLALAPAGGVAAAGPEKFGDSYTDYVFDEFIFELCGIETWTTVTERWFVTVYPNGAERLHVVRLFVPDDPRIPIEKGAGVGYTAPDGSRTVTGLPALLFDPDGGIRIMAAGRAIFDQNGDLVSSTGRTGFLDADEADLYCPA